MIKRGPATIRGLVVVVAGVSSLLTALVGVATFSLVHHAIERQLDHRIELETWALQDVYRHTSFEVLIKTVASREHQDARGAIGYLVGSADAASGMGYMVIDGQGRQRGGSLQARIPPAGWSEFVHFRRPDGSSGVAQAMNSPLSGGGWLVVTADRAVLRQIDQSLVKLFLAEFGMILLVGALAAIGFGRVVEARLGAIQVAARGIMAGDLSRRMAVDGSGGEFDHLAQVLNRMLDRIGLLMDNLRQVSGDIAHDLRTPLSRLRSRLEGLEERASEAGQQRDLAEALHEVDDLQDLLSGLLALSEIEAQAARARFAPVALDRAVEELAEAYGPALDAANLALRLNLRPVTLMGDRSLLQRAVANLLDNSLLHAAAGTGIDITLGWVSGRIELTVADDGPGIDAADRDRVFQRFVRLDPSRSSPGHGLGLSIVSAVVAAHGGQVRVAPSIAGLVIVVSLPATIEPPPAAA